MDKMTLSFFAAEILALLTMMAPVWVSNHKIRKGQLCQLRSDMLQIYYHNKDNKKIRQYELQNFLLLYEAYKALKGNSFIDTIKEEVITWEMIT